MMLLLTSLLTGRGRNSSCWGGEEAAIPKENCCIGPNGAAVGVGQEEPP
jgi:hypothetical protein